MTHYITTVSGCSSVKVREDGVIIQVNGEDWWVGEMLEDTLNYLKREGTLISIVKRGEKQDD